MKKRVFLLRKLSEMFDALSFVFSVSKPEAADAVNKLSAMEQFSCFPFLITMRDNFYYGCNFSDVWSEAVLNSAELGVLTEEEKRCLCEFSDDIGNICFDSLKSRLNVYSRRFVSFGESADEYYRRTCRLCVSSGVLSAFMLFLILV